MPVKKDVPKKEKLKMRITVKSFDHRLLDKAVKKIVTIVTDS
jgi:ribosomal protein S10